MAQPEYSFSTFLKEHQPQLEAAGIRPELWGALYKKLLNQVFDAGESFRIVCQEDDKGRKEWNVLALKDMDPVDEDCVFLIDHMWTFRPHQARSQLEAMPELAERLKDLMDIDDDQDSECSDDEVTTEAAEQEKIQKITAQMQEAAVADGDGPAGVGSIPRHESVDARLCFSLKERNGTIDKIMKKLWQYANTYTVRYKTDIDEEGMPVWYVMDEFGSKIQHQDEANAKVVPILFVPQNIAYNVLYLVKPVVEEQEITRDFVDTLVCKQHPAWRDLLYYPWEPMELDGEWPRQVPDDAFFLSGRREDKLPTAEEQKAADGARPKGMRKLRIFADSEQLIKNLKDVEYELVDSWEKADVIWLMKHFHEYQELCQKNPAALVNQFPYESCLNVKDLLAAILMQMNNGEGPEWYQKTYNITNELPQFVAYFQKRAAAGMDNTWIVKPWNLARGLDMHVSNDVGHMIRLLETGPKIVSKYIERPLLFPRTDNGHKVKFDLRYIIFVDSLKPVEAYVYNKFWIRFAINEFQLDDFDDLETHFTVFNYGDKSKILQMNCDDFVVAMEKAYPFLKWNEVQTQINGVLKSALEAVSRADPPRGVAANVQSRAMYGADIMLQWKGNEPESSSSVQATLLECNFMPDCERACVYYPDFADTVFKTLFLDGADPTRVTAL